MSQEQLGNGHYCTQPQADENYCASSSVGRFGIIRVQDNIRSTYLTYLHKNFRHANVIKITYRDRRDT